MIALLRSCLLYAVSSFDKVLCALHSVYGWLLGVLIFTLNLLLGYKEALGTVLVCVLLDTLWGICAQVKQKRFILSELGRNKMLTKWGFYLSLILAFVFMEMMLGLDSHLSVIAICTYICLVEVWSMSASVLIIYPRMPFLRLFQKFLEGEIASKMGCSAEEVTAALHNLERVEPAKPKSDSASEPTE